MLRVELLQVLDDQQMLRCDGSKGGRLAGARAASSKTTFAPFAVISRKTHLLASSSPGINPEF